MNDNAIKLTPDQALTIVRQVAAHPQLRFLNLEEHGALQTAIETIAQALKPAATTPTPLDA